MSKTPTGRPRGVPAPHTAHGQAALQKVLDGLMDYSSEVERAIVHGGQPGDLPSAVATVQRAVLAVLNASGGKRGTR